MLVFSKSNLQNIILFIKDNNILGSHSFKFDISKFIEVDHNIVHASFIENDILYKVIICAIKDNNYLEIGKNIAKYTADLSWKIIDPKIELKNLYLILEGILYSTYLFDKYKEKKAKLPSFYIDIPQDISFINLIDSINFARDLLTEPANYLYPKAYVQQIQEKFKNLSSVNIKVLNTQDMQNLGMNLLLGVGQGSNYESYAVIMEYKNNSSSEDNIIMVGKGVTFDTGGISLKPALNMHEMTKDMGGSAAVVGGVLAAAKNQLNVNLIGIIGLVENAIGPKAQRPGDIVTSMDGLTVEILNTDAEGRLVLADLITYAIKHYKIKFLMTYATLTGAVSVCLDKYAAGLFASDDKYLSMIQKSANESAQLLWHLPMNDFFVKFLKKSKIADLYNISYDCRAGSSIAASFLMIFAKNISYYHVDIAGVASDDQFGTGYGVKQIYQICLNSSL